MLDTKALADATAAVVREVVDAAVNRATAQLLARIDVLERREIAPDVDALRGMVAEAVAGIELPKPKDGKDGTSIDSAEVRAWVSEAVAAMPPAKDGESVAPETVKAMVAEAVGAIELPQPRDGEDGQSVDPVEVRAWINEEVAALPAPQDGKSVTMAEVEPIIMAAVEKAVTALPVAKDGVGLAGALIDRTGSLIVTMSDGRTCDLGRVEAEPATPGKDGLGFDDLTFEHDGEREFVLRFVRGETVKEFPFTVPVVLDRGVYREGQKYAAGDGVTWAGCYWIAQKDTDAKPDSGDGFRLAVKRGRNGKDAQGVAQP